MKKTTYYNAENPDVELEIFMNIKDEITVSMTDGMMPEITISLNKEEVEELIIDLQKLLKQIQ